MKAFLSAIAAAALITVGSNLALKEIYPSSGEASTSQGNVRLGDNG